MSFSDWFKPVTPPKPEVKYPETAQDGGVKETSENHDPHFFTPQYPGLVPVGSLPITEDENVQWQATLQGKFIPYRGDEPHGLDIDVDPSKLPVNDIDLIAARGHGYGKPVGENITPPVAVTIVNTPPLFGIENRFATNLYAMPTGTAIQIAGRRPERSAIRIGINNSTPVYVGPTEGQVKALLGFLLSPNGFITLNTNQPVWAFTTDVNVNISVVEEYTVVEGMRRI